MPQISYKVRALAADLLSACASEIAHFNRPVYIAEINREFLDGEGLDLTKRDQVEQLAALTFREFYVYGSDMQSWIDAYLECAERIRDGFTPNMDS